ncbi:peptide deformylase [Primorskyibacter sp. 2E107]|uniref:peptide deformylase n=1 Tax=Primorskyibacter sp. 2E107 TaxID=3403458 RepID=UPI003AF61E62
MSALDILTWPDARLAQVCAPVADAGDIANLADDMFQIMYRAQGRGLAGPQVGLMQRVFVMDAGWKVDNWSPRTCINPEIIARSKTTQIGPEGCLSMPGVTAQVTRHEMITLGYMDLWGDRQSVDLTGAEAIIAQHELDHLDGVMHFDRLDAAAKALLLAQYEGQA